MVPGSKAPGFLNREPAPASGWFPMINVLEINDVISAQDTRLFILGMHERPHFDIPFLLDSGASLSVIADWLFARTGWSLTPSKKLPAMTSATGHALVPRGSASMTLKFDGRSVTFQVIVVSGD